MFHVEHNVEEAVMSYPSEGIQICSTWNMH